jgi:hypothetical protein
LNPKERLRRYRFNADGHFDANALESKITVYDNGFNQTARWYAE